MSSFHALPLLPTLVESLREQDIRTPTEIQDKTIPALLEGRGVVGVAETGSGKTLAYVLPTLHRLKTLENEGDAVSAPARPRGLVLVPGRELGEQVARVFKGLTHKTRLRVRSALGGTAKQVARQRVNAPFEVLVATPGRLLQLLDAKELHLDDVRVLVFDEADQVVDPGFLPVAKRLVDACPNSVQLVMFSATIPHALDTVVATLFKTKPLRVRTKGSSQLVPTLRTDNRSVVDGNRFDVLMKVLAEAPDAGTLLFANTRDQCDRVGNWLESEDVPFAMYRGEMDQKERRASLKRFRAGEISVLIATDLGGRGLDIERIERVVNVHLPRQVDNYLHRAGRTARAGRDGVVINLVTARDEPLMAKLARKDKRRR